jgi:acetolactate synthase I/II/III large subunit
MKASDLFIKCLVEEGLEYVFGVPGEENADFVWSMKDEKSIKFVLTRHEQGAAFMADVYGRLTGRPAVCLGTLGPGATNLTTGVADANMDRAPCICITGQAHSQRQHKESHQNMDVVGMFRPITKWSQAIIHPNNIPEVVRKAFKLSMTEKPGACHIELAEDIAAMDATTKPISPQRVRRPGPDDKIVDRAWELIKKARKPVIIAGNGCIRKRSAKMLRSLCEKTGIGVISTFMGKGAVDRDADYCLMTVGLQARDYPKLAIEESDCVICLGYDLVEYHPTLWNPNADKTIIHIDFLPAEVDENYRVDVEIAGDLAHTLWMLNERCDRDKPEYDLETQASLRQKCLDDFAMEKDDDAKGDMGLKPQKVLWDVREVMGPEDILLSDVGAHKMWIARYYQCNEPGTCLISNGFCTMGFAFPGSIAAQLVFPDRKVLSINGDGGFMMNVQEMETARRLNSNIVCMVWQDGGYGLIKWKQFNHFKGHTELDFTNPNWVQLAEAFGWTGLWCDDSSKLKETLEKAFATPGPVLLALPIDYRENAKLTERLGNIPIAI